MLPAHASHKYIFSHTFTFFFYFRYFLPRYRDDTSRPGHNLFLLSKKIYTAEKNPQDENKRRRFSPYVRKV